jgi:anti-anti-sigma regulatory factor
MQISAQAPGRWIMHLSVYSASDAGPEAPLVGSAAQVLAQSDSPGANGIRDVVCDLSAPPTMDVAGARILAELYQTLKNPGIGLTITNARGRMRDLPRAEGFYDKIKALARGTPLQSDLRTITAMGRPNND